MLNSIDIKLMDGDIVSDDYQRMKNNTEFRKEHISTKLASLRPRPITKSLIGYFRILIFCRSKKKELTN
jgi:hypothetical protein